MEEIPSSPTKVRTIVLFSMLFALLGAVVVFAYFSTFTRPLTTVIVVRHAEKNIEPNNSNPNLSPAGQQRAQELARILEGSGVNAIYATQFLRTQQTALPLASKLGQQVIQVDSSDTGGLVNKLVAHRGGTFFVVGHSNTVPAIIKALGGPAYPEIPDNEYDNMFVVTIYRTGKAQVTKLKFGSPSASGGGPMMTRP